MIKKAERQGPAVSEEPKEYPLDYVEGLNNAR
jgi:hypothetical protein